MRVQRDLLIERLIERLHDEAALIRRNAAGALRLHGDRARAAIPTLETLLEDPSPMVRAEARRALECLTAGTKVA